MSTIMIAVTAALIILPAAMIVARRRWLRRNFAAARLARLKEIVRATEYHAEPAPQRTSPADSALLRGPGG